MSERIKHGLRNAGTSLFFYFIMLGLNLFSRKIFLEYLGDTLSGLVTTMQFTVGLLNMADIGISTAIIYALFKPIYDDDREEINRIISLFCYLFRLIGIGVVIAGTVIMFLMPSFLEDQVPPVTIMLSFLTFLATSSLSYFVNYKQYLLSAYQRGYVIVRIFNITTITKIVLQMAALMWLGGGYASFLILEVVAAVVYSWLLERCVGREYPWLKPSFALGRSIKGEYKPVFRNLKQIVSHKFAAVVLTQTDSVVIAHFISLTTVTLYYNYAMIISKLTTFVTSCFSGAWAGVGNLISEGDRDKIQHVFWQYATATMFLAGVLCGCARLLADPFISVWLGERYLLDDATFVCMLAALYIALLRQPITVFLNGYGLYKDVWSAWLEAGLNIVISVVGGMMYGLIGVVVGTLVSTGVVVLLWKPVFLYREGFCRVGVLSFYTTLFKYLTLLAATHVMVGWLMRMAPPVGSLSSFFALALATVAAYGVTYALLLLPVSSSLRSVFVIVLRKTLERL